MLYNGDDMVDTVVTVLVVGVDCLVALIDTDGMHCVLKLLLFKAN